MVLATNSKDFPKLFASVKTDEEKREAHVFIRPVQSACALGNNRAYIGVGRAAHTSVHRVCTSIGFCLDI